MIITDEGIYENVSIRDYHDSDGISSSGIRLIVPPNCPKLYAHHFLNKEVLHAEGSSFLIGNALHCMVLEPGYFDERFAVFPKIDRRTKEGKEKYAEFIEESCGKYILTCDQYELIHDMALSINSNSVFSKIFYDGKFNVENSLAWKDKDYSVLLRSRPDFYNDSVILDIKTSRDVRAASFRNSIAEYGYHAQAAMACDGLTKLTGRKYDTFILVVVSKDSPHLVKTYVMNDSSIQEGRILYKLGAKIYSECIENNYWSGYKEEVEETDLPLWAKTFFEQQE